MFETEFIIKNDKPQRLRALLSKALQVQVSDTTMLHSYSNACYQLPS
ncbi:MAG: hypothetical protein JWQ96_870 [Segetibacter sp.]|nr:hypothetical protein [Segetibacter sp.]